MSSADGKTGDVDGIRWPESGSLAWGRILASWDNSVYSLAVWPVWTGMIPGDCRTILWEVGWICGLITPCDVNCLCAVMNRRIKGIQGDVVVVMTDRVEDNRLQRCADACDCLNDYYIVLCC